MEFLKNIEKAQILVIGDVMLDRYLWGTVTRISPEAPVPIVRMSKSSLAAGGAANVAVNIAGLGATPVLVGVVGCDSEAEMLRKLLGENGVSAKDLIQLPDRPTTVKTRIIAHSQQVARVDQEIDDEPSTEQIDQIVDIVKRHARESDAIVISDYAKGLLTAELLASILQIGSVDEKPVLIDPKGKNYSKYRGATLLTPNRREAAEACNLEEGHPDIVEFAGRQLIADHGFGSVLITRGEEGMTLFQNGTEPIHFSALARQIYDVTGAGDTVIATLASVIAAGSSLETAAMVANVAAGLVVEQVGTTPIKLVDLKGALNGR